jgi:hypothetical protein
MSGAALASVTLPRGARRPEVDTTLGMAIFIGSWTMAFATLFCGRPSAWRCRR